MNIDPYERRGGCIVHGPFSENMEDFMSFIDLTDIKPYKSKYNWNNRRIGLWNIMARLDIFLVRKKN